MNFNVTIYHYKSRLNMLIQRNVNTPKMYQNDSCTSNYSYSISCNNMNGG